MEDRAQLVGEHIFIMIVEYKSQSPKSRKSHTFKQGFMFKGFGVDALTKEDYLKAKDYITDGFHLEE